MTERQEDLFDELKASFNQMNRVPSTKGNLINVGAIKKTLVEADTFKAEIEATNKVFTNLLKERCKIAFDSIKEDIENLGLVISMYQNGDNGFRIGTKANERGQACGMNIEFTFRSGKHESISLADGGCVTKYLEPMVKYETNEQCSWGMTCAQFEPFLRADYFISRLTKMTAHAQKNKCAA